MNPPTRLFFNVITVDSTKKQSRYSSMNRIITEVVGLIVMRKTEAPSTTSCYLAASGFHSVA